MKRPFAVTLLAIVAVVAGLIAVMDTLRYLGLLPITALGELNFFGTNIFGAILAGIVALIWFSVARQLWNLDAQGWLFVVVIAIFNLILAGRSRSSAARLFSPLDWDSLSASAPLR